MPTVSELIPNDSHKSFYGKAKISFNNDGSKILYSYNTPVMLEAADGTLHRLWAGYSATTGRHIRAFCGVDKKTWENMEVEKYENHS